MSDNSHLPAPHQVSVEVGGRTLTLETGKVAKQANGAVYARYGDTVVLVTACMASTLNERDFLPLTVDYREYTYSAGKIPGGFFKREGRPSEREILVSRLIDRPMRPLFPDAWRNETQIVAMVVAGSLEVSEVTVVDALEFAHAQIKRIIGAIRELHAKLNPTKVVVAPLPFDDKLDAEIEKKHGARLHDALNTEKHPKKQSYHLVDALKAEIAEAIPEEEEEKRALALRAFERLREKYFRDDILLAHRRPDGRAFDQVRAITCEVGMLPRVHGSALFTRGETQALATLTLGTKEDMQRLDLLFEQDTFKRFMLHYNFPPFSVGEVKFLRGPGRREIGHGALAERSLMTLLPPETDFPYAMRLVSDILESNGSSSMATVCGASLAMMDAGVPIKAACAGIAMGLVVGDHGKYAILTDIAGAEDQYGDMDSK